MKIIAVSAIKNIVQLYFPVFRRSARGLDFMGGGQLDTSTHLNTGRIYIYPHKCNNGDTTARPAPLNQQTCLSSALHTLGDCAPALCTPQTVALNAKLERRSTSFTSAAVLSTAMHSTAVTAATIWMKFRPKHGVYNPLPLRAHL